MRPCISPGESSLGEPSLGQSITVAIFLGRQLYNSSTLPANFGIVRRQLAFLTANIPDFLLSKDWS